MKKVLVLASILIFAKIGLTAQIAEVLERSTVEEVAQTFSERLSKQLDNCFLEYRKDHNDSAVMLTKNVLRKFRSNYPVKEGRVLCSEPYDLRDVYFEILDSRARKRVTISTAKSWLYPYAVKKLEPAVKNGIVGFKGLPMQFYKDLILTNDLNAMKREKNPRGVNLAELRKAWTEVGEGNLDQEYYNPVVFPKYVLDGEEIFSEMRKYFPITQLSLDATGKEAIDAFWNSNEGPEGDPKFALLAESLGKSSIRKRFYFSGGGSEPFGWSRNVLIVVDEHNQMWGLMMGYSE